MLQWSGLPNAQWLVTENPLFMSVFFNKISSQIWFQLCAVLLSKLRGVAQSVLPERPHKSKSLCCSWSILSSGSTIISTFRVVCLPFHGSYKLKYFTLLFVCCSFSGLRCSQLTWLFSNVFPVRVQKLLSSVLCHQSLSKILIG